MAEAPASKPDQERDAPDEAAGEEAEGSPEGESSEHATGQAKAPWHFKFFVVASVVYLGYRAYQGIEWLSHHI